MTGHLNGLAARRPLPLELRWDDRRRPLPTRWVLPDLRRRRGFVPRRFGSTPIDYCGRLRRLCEDVADRCPALGHVRMPHVLLSFTPCRNRSPYGLQARVTPLRFRDGAMVRRQSGVEYQVQRYFVDGREMLYVLTFCLPRFLDQPFEEKLVTVFHELYHMSEAFDGDLRRHPGRYAVHSHSKDRYDEQMLELVTEFLADHPDTSELDFLRYGYKDLWERHGGITGVVVPRPKLLPVGWATQRVAAQGR
jgi:hypothetical protein